MNLLGAIVREWADRNPKIRRVWLSGTVPGDDATPPSGNTVSIALELQPVGDSEETVLVWLANGEKWRRELRTRIGRLIDLQWLDPDQATGHAENMKRTLLYEQAQ